MARVGAYLTREERLRRIGELLLKGVYLWADAVEVSAVDENSTSAARDGRAADVDPPCADHRPRRTAPMRATPCAGGGAEHADGLGRRRRRRERRARTLVSPGADLPSSAGTSGSPDTNGTAA